MALRVASLHDEVAIANVCVKTAELGADGSHLYGDRLLHPDIFARPYLHHGTGFGFVWEELGEVIGYTIGTSDTRAFQAWFSDQWWPKVADGRTPATPRALELFDMANDPTRLLIDEVDDYPAHLHIDMLPACRGKGVGRALIEAAVEFLDNAGVAGLHMTAPVANEGAAHFYPKLGFGKLREFGGQSLFARAIERDLYTREDVAARPHDPDETGGGA